jgi:LCP family protein required for cell wall assembly
LTFLVVGSDSREGLSDRQVRRLHTGWDVYGERTDTMMLAHLRRDGGIDVVSLPRDSLARIPSYVDESGQSHGPSDQKLNSAFAYGGPPLLVRTVEELTDVRVDHYVEVDFAGFVSMVNALGGVQVCTPADIYDPPSGLQLPAGRSVLAGRDALAYVRARAFDPTADIGRMRRQQTFVASMVHKAASSEVMLDPGRAGELVDAIMGSLRVDGSLDNAGVMELARRLAQVDPSRVTFRTVPVVGERSMGEIGNVVLWDGPGSEAIFTALREDTPVPDRPKAPKVDVAPPDIHIQLLGDGSSAEEAFADFSAAGYTVHQAVPGSLDATTIEYDPGYDVSLKTLQAALPGAESVEVPGLGGTFRVTVGDDYEGLTTVSVNDPTASDTPRRASDDICD